MSACDIFTINGKSGDSIEPLMVKEGEKVRLRLINVGWEGTAGMKTLIKYDDSEGSSDSSNQEMQLPEFNYMNYGVSEEAGFTLEQDYDVEYTMNLNTKMDGEGQVFTINGKTFPETGNIDVKEGDLVKVTLTNRSMIDDHPMHLHGHFFQVLSKNGKPVEGSSINRDTINLKPGEEVVVAFKADNPGNWLFHCHDLHHATAGMVNMVSMTALHQVLHQIRMQAISLNNREICLSPPWAAILS